MAADPHVAILIPARNESRDIGAALDAVLSQDHPHEHIEVVVVTGGSDDDTARIASARLEVGGFQRVLVVEDSDGSTPRNLNAGLAACRAPYVCRVDARSIVPVDYVRRCVSLLENRPDIAVVGGAQVAHPRSRSTVDLGISRALNNRWGMGLSRYRRGVESGPTETVYLGVFRTAELRAVGGWDERFDTNQDFDLNRRMGRNGVIWFESELAVGYMPRPSIPLLFAQYRRFGRWKVRYWQLTGDAPRPRQRVLLAVLPGALAGAVAVAKMSGRHRVLAAVAACGALAAFDVGGSDRQPAALRVRATALAASVAIGSGWSIGAWTGLLRPDPT